MAVHKIRLAGIVDADTARAAGFGFDADTALAARLKVTKQAIALARKRFGIEPPASAQREARLKTIRDNSHKTAPQLAQLLGVSESTVRADAREIGVRLAMGQRSKPSAYSNEQIFSAIEKAEGNMTRAARILGTHMTNLYYMIRTRGLRDKIPYRSDK